MCGLSISHGLGREPRRSHERSSVLGLLCRCRSSSLKSTKGVDRNSELKQRLQLWESGQINALVGLVVGQQNSGPLRRTARKTQVQDEQRRKRACALTARGSVSKAMKGLVGGAAQGSAYCRRNRSTALISTELGHWNSSHRAECVEASRFAWGGGRYTLARGAMREHRRNKTGR